jgi:hypothetical protein
MEYDVIFPLNSHHHFKREIYLPLDHQTCVHRTSNVRLFMSETVSYHQHLCSIVC